MITIQHVMDLEAYLRVCCAEICNNKELINDSIQDTYLYILERERADGLDFLEWKGKANKHYLRMLATHKLLMRLRSDSRRVARNEQYMGLHGEFEHLESEHDHNVRAGLVLDGIDELEPYSRELIKLVYFRKTKQKDLAEALELPYITIKRDVKKARELIREKVNAETRKAS
jgi:RNA polymerase sigma factor (sigma-70 family)